MTRKPPSQPPGSRGSAPTMVTAAAGNDAETLAAIARAIRAGPDRTVHAGPGSTPPALVAAPDSHSDDPPSSLAAIGAGDGAVAAGLARLAHELKTPLGAIRAAAEIMKDERLGPMGGELYRGYAADIYVSAGHALDVLARVLDGLRAGGALGTTKTVLSYAEIDLDALVTATVSSVSSLADNARVTLTARADPGLPHVIADAVSVRQILINLLTNALRAAGPGGTVDVSLAYVLDGPVTVSVADSGPGIGPKSGLTPMNNPSPSSGPEPDLGLRAGIGLPLVIELARLNGAEFAIGSVSGFGTTAKLIFARDRVIPV